MSLSTNKIKQYRTIGHGLNPVVTVAGKGLTENVIAELNRALDDHELIKIKVAVTDRDARKALISELCNNCRAQLIQEIGKVALIFREVQKPDPKKSNIR
ncbi:YhbY family RNA-binding protein [Teredinibacter franksiae]|jgi:Predicted RNA-binding protein containing KH domain, possibly ribosomal protein|uniref:YhbY family RNA-binding protein n=1 Tax=Teredinibacter franksiae TaxID=2761453 RepID=UPI001623B760|nr:YhbY family RNA-binding protein [Teredinibacter franksiae]